MSTSKNNNNNKNGRNGDSKMIYFDHKRELISISEFCRIYNARRDKVTGGVISNRGSWLVRKKKEFFIDIGYIRAFKKERDRLISIVHKDYFILSHYIGLEDKDIAKVCYEYSKEYTYESWYQIVRFKLFNYDENDYILKTTMPKHYVEFINVCDEFIPYLMKRYRNAMRKIGETAKKELDYL